MGRERGYLAAMSGLATGAERVYLPEEGVSRHDMRADTAALTQGFQNGERLGPVVRNEDVNHPFTTGFMRTLLDEEGGGLFDARQAVRASPARWLPEPVWLDSRHLVGDAVYSASD